MKISLCIPTSGVAEWIVPAVDSIYSQGVDEKLFEVIVTENGTDDHFKEIMEHYENAHKNFIYRHTRSEMFENQIDALSLATGDYIKFINHRQRFLPNALMRMIDFVKQNLEDKPIVFWSNGNVKLKEIPYRYSNFDDYVSGLGHWITWSGGLGGWKEDIYAAIRKNEFDSLFPHIGFLFARIESCEYIINNCVYLDESPTDNSKKGRYDLFYAFAVGFPMIMLEYLQQKTISLDTFLRIKRDNAFFVADQYRRFVIEKNECSYLIENHEFIDVFYSIEIIENIINGEDSLLDSIVKDRVQNLNMESKAVAIFGACDNAVSLMQNFEDDDVVCFLDNNEKKQGTIYKGIPVVSVEKYKELSLEYPVMICVNPINKKKITNQLEQNSINYIE